MPLFKDVVGGRNMLSMRRLRQSRLVFGVAVASLFTSCRPIGLNYDSSFNSGTPPMAQHLAAELDSLEREIDRYGSVVAQQPSVWGQSRLSKYRDEFEQTM